ncbi:MAG: RdgB/HAM1 family non-canonical purine NTP pyrophosphatase [Parvularculaceae bacterium]
MPRQFTSPSLVIASHNAGKIREIRALFTPLGVACDDAAALGLAEPEETGASFETNAELKARAAAEAAGLPALADDSGLAVDALGGAPGIYSARWAGESRDFGVAMARVEEELQRANAGKTPENRAASFVCALTLAWPDGHCETFRGEIAGRIVWPPRGEKGFGYDPIFVAEGMTETFGEIDPAEKHAISHRARAFAALLEGCFAGRS